MLLVQKGTGIVALEYIVLADYRCLAPSNIAVTHTLYNWCGLGVFIFFLYINRCDTDTTHGKTYRYFFMWCVKEIVIFIHVLDN